MYSHVSSCVVQTGEELQVDVSYDTLHLADELQGTTYHRELLGAYCQICEDGENDEVSDNDSEYHEEDENGYLVLESTVFGRALSRARDFLFTLFSSSPSSVSLFWPYFFYSFTHLAFSLSE